MGVDSSAVIEVPLNVVIDEYDEESYVSNGGAPITVDLSKVTMQVLHPEDGGDQALLLIKRKRKSRFRSEFTDEDVLEELQRAEEHFENVPGGYVGYGYFIHHWKSRVVPFGMKARDPVLQRLASEGKVICYDASDGKKAVRTA